MNFISDDGNLLPTSLQSNHRKFKAVDEHQINYLGEVQIYPKLDTMADTCLICNIKALIMKWDEKVIVEGAACPGAIIPVNTFLVHSELDVKDFIDDNAERLYSLYFGNINLDPALYIMGKIGVTLLRSSKSAPDDRIFSAKFIQESPCLCNIIPNGYFHLRKDDYVD